MWASSRFMMLGCTIKLLCWIFIPKKQKDWDPYLCQVSLTKRPMENASSTIITLEGDDIFNWFLTFFFFLYDVSASTADHHWPWTLLKKASKPTFLKKPFISCFLWRDVLSPNFNFYFSFFFLCSTLRLFAQYKVHYK